MGKTDSTWRGNSSPRIWHMWNHVTPFLRCKKGVKGVQVASTNKESHGPNKTETSTISARISFHTVHLFGMIWTNLLVYILYLLFINTRNIQYSLSSFVAGFTKNQNCPALWSNLLAAKQRVPLQQCFWETWSFWNTEPFELSDLQIAANAYC